MTDTGQVPGEGLPENAGGPQDGLHFATPAAPADHGVPEQPGPAAPGIHPPEGPSGGGAEDDLLLMPGTQGAWSDPSAVQPLPPSRPTAPGHGPQATASVPLPPPDRLPPRGVPQGPAAGGTAAEEVPAVPVDRDRPARRRPRGATTDAFLDDPADAPSPPPAPQAEDTLPPPPAPQAEDAPAAGPVPSARPGAADPSAPSGPADGAPDAFAPLPAGPHEDGGAGPAGAGPAGAGPAGAPDTAAATAPLPPGTQQQPAQAPSVQQPPVPGPRAGAAAPSPAPAGPARRPLHLGPPVPSEPSGGVVRSLADRGPARAPGARPPAGPPTLGPEYLDVPREEAPPTPVPAYAQQAPGSLPGPQLGHIPQLGPHSGAGDAWSPQDHARPVPAAPGAGADPPADGPEQFVPGPEAGPQSHPATAPEATQVHMEIPQQTTGERPLPAPGHGRPEDAGAHGWHAVPSGPVAAEGTGLPGEFAHPADPVHAAHLADPVHAQAAPQEWHAADEALPAGPYEQFADASVEQQGDGQTFVPQPGGRPEEGPAAPHRALADELVSPRAVPGPRPPEPAPQTPAQEPVAERQPAPGESVAGQPPGAEPPGAEEAHGQPFTGEAEEVHGQPFGEEAEEAEEAAAERFDAGQPGAERSAAGESAPQGEPFAEPEPQPQPRTEPEAEGEPRPGPVPAGPAAPPYDEAEREAVLRVMRERRDIRQGFRPDPIPHEVLLRVLEAAHTAPSVGHSQPWDFVVIRSEETRRTMHELAERQREAYAKSLPKGRAKQFKQMKIEAILDTPVNIVVTADSTRGGRHTLGRHTQPQMAPYSSALAVENLWLAARAEGLGVGWVSFFDEREMVRALGLPEHLEVVAYLCVGYVDEFPAEPELTQTGWSKRRPLSWVVHEEAYGRRALPGEDPHDLLAETLQGIRPLDAKALGEAWERQKRMTKPSGALGMLEIISAQLSGLSRQCPPPIPEPAAVAVFAGDHGVHAQGVTAWPQEVTAQMVANFLGGGAVCNAFATQVGAEVCVVDVGVAADLPKTAGLLPRKVRHGTDDFTTGPALSRGDALRAVEVGIETARDLVAAGNKALLTGEMGIGNTTVSAALVAVYTGQDPAEVTGRGTGVDDETYARKIHVVRRGLELHQPDPADPIGVLAAFGGLEHAALVGLLLGGASLRTPVILDGVSAGAAALVARAIAPEVLAACIAGHRSAEPGHLAALTKLGLRPLVDLDLRLGEGTGALLALPLVQSAARAMHEVATFDAAGVTEKA